MTTHGTPSTSSAQRPGLYLHPEAWEHLKEYYDGAAASLERYFHPSPARPSSSDIAIADRVATVLEPVCYTSDADCSYFACVLTDTDIENDDLFYRGLGIGQDQQVEIGGATCRKLETIYGPCNGEENCPTICLLTNFDADDVDLIDEYISDDDQVSYNEAAEIFERTGTVVGGYLCADDAVSRIVFTFAKTPTAAWVGVLTVSIET